MIVSLSGGLDSAVLLAKVIDEHSEPLKAPLAVTFKYGSKHNTLEANAALRVAAYYSMTPRQVDLEPAFRGVKSALTRADRAVPEGHYEAESMRATVVPGRNLIFASVLASIAESEGHSSIALGMHAGDAMIYPDCRPQFIRSLGYTIGCGSDGEVYVETPFINIDKVGIVKLGLKLNVPFHLTRTCYTSAAVACGKCGSCQERLSAFAAIGVEDPIEYVTREIMPKE